MKIIINLPTRNHNEWVLKVVIIELELLLLGPYFMQALTGDTPR